MTKSKFRVFYRWKVEKGQEKEFEKKWRAITLDYKKKYGALGSCLHRVEDGSYVAYAKWPTRKHWEKMQSDNKGQKVNPVAQPVHDPIELEVVSDYLD